MAEDGRSLDSLLDELERNHSPDSRSPSTQSGSAVYLNIYDMVWLNEYTVKLGIGAFHTGVHVYGKEYAYGGHPYSYSGVYDMEPKQVEEIAGQGVKFRETFFVGHTSLPEKDIREIVRILGKEYNGNAYNLLKKNCNHFSSHMCQRLCGVDAPRWVNRLAYLASWTPWIVNCIPPSWVTPPVTEGEAEAVSHATHNPLYSSHSQSQKRNT